MTQGFAAPQDTPLNMPNCGMLAVAMLTGASFEEVTTKFNEYRSTKVTRNGRKRKEFGKGWKGRTTHDERMAVIKAFGFDPLIWRFGDRSLLHFAVNQEKGWPMIVTVRGHAMTVLNGRVYDQSYPQGIEAKFHPMKKSVVKDVVIAKGRKASL